MKKLILLLLIIHANQFNGLSQSSNWTHYQYECSVKDFVFEGSVVWMISEAGLLSYDTTTNQSRIYNHANSGMPNNHPPTALAIDSNGNKWIGGDFNGFYKFDGATWTNFTNTNSGLIGVQVFSLAVDSLNRLWIGTGSGINIFDGSTWINYNDLGNGINPNVYEIKIKNGLVWCATDVGLARFDGSAWFTYSTTNSNIHHDNVKHLSITSSGTIWLTSGGDKLTKFDGTDWVNYADSALACPAPTLPSEFFAADDSGNVWFYKNNPFEIVKFDGISCTVYDTTTIGGSIRFQPHAIRFINGNVYFATERLIRFNGNSLWENYYFKTNPFRGSSIITHVAIDKDNSYWFADWGSLAGLNHFDGVNWVRFETPINAGITAMAIDSSGIIWIGTYDNGLFSFDGINFIQYLNNKGISKIVIDSLQNLWIATRLNGAYYYDHSTFTNYKISNSGIVSDSLSVLAIDTAGVIWFGSTNKGICSYDGTQWQIFNQSNSGLPSNKINDLKCDSSNNVWMATSDSGLVKKAGNNWFTYNVSNSGMFLNFVTVIGIGTNQNIYVQDRIFDGSNWIIINDSSMGLSIGAQYWMDFANDKWGNIIYVGNWGIDFYNNRNLNFEHHPSIIGKVYFDANNNGVIDTLDKGMFNQKIVSYPDSVIAFTNSSGSYSYGKAQGNYDVTFIPQPSWLLTTDSASYNINLGPLDASGFDFGTYANNPVDSVSLSLTTGIPRCNLTVPFWISYTNAGTTLLNGQIKLKIDTLVTYASSSPAVDSINGDTLIWYFNLLYPGEQRQIEAGFIAPSVNSIGTELNFTGIIVGQNNQILDSEYYQNEVFCSYDPNDKLVAPSGFGPNHYTHFNDSIEYTIRFQNCGNDTAFNIKIVDTLDASFDLNSFHFIAASHPVYPSITQQGVVKFRFDSIMLPCKTTNEPMSQGFAKYSILHKPGLPDPTVVKNYASIYFDANPPIFTNQTLNTLSDIFAGIPDLHNKNLELLKLYPNPAKDNITLVPSTKSKYTLTIYNILGSVMHHSSDHSGVQQIELKRIPHGIYFYRVIFNNGENCSGRFVVMH